MMVYFYSRSAQHVAMCYAKKSWLQEQGTVYNSFPWVILNFTQPRYCTAMAQGRRLGGKGACYLPNLEAQVGIRRLCSYKEDSTTQLPASMVIGGGGTVARPITHRKEHNQHFAQSSFQKHPWIFPEFSRSNPCGFLHLRLTQTQLITQHLEPHLFLNFLA